MDFFYYFFMMDIFVKPHIPKSDISGRWAGNAVLAILLSFKINPDFSAWFFLRARNGYDSISQNLVACNIYELPVTVSLKF
jgi:hypothetical protein